MTRNILFGLLVFSLTACGVVRNTASRVGIGSGSASRAQVEIEGTNFRARTNVENSDRRLMKITVSPFAIDPEGAVEAGRYQATRYCILTYGGSDTEWIIGPDLPLEELPVTDDTLMLEGRCTQR